MLTPSYKVTGFTLVELLISLLLGSFLLAMLISLYVNSVSASAEALKFSKLRTDLQAIITLIENDIRRSGYGGNEYMVGENNNKVFDIINSETQKCIVYAYNDDLSESVNPSHFMAFRYSTGSQSVQFGRKVDSQAINCFNSGYWANLTDPNFVKITLLTFSESTAVNGQITKRSVDIKLEGELVNNKNYKYKVETHVQARNIEFN